MPAEQIRLLLIEDVPQVASHIRSLLNAQSQIKMLDVVTAGDRAVGAVDELKPHVVIVDALLQGRVSGAQVVQGIRGAEPQVGLIMLTVPQNPVREDAQRGIDAVLKMPFSGFDLTTMVRKVAEDRAVESARTGSLMVTLFSPKGGVGPHDDRLQPGGRARTAASGLPGRRLAPVQRPAGTPPRPGCGALDRQPADRSHS